MFNMQLVEPLNEEQINSIMAERIKRAQEEQANAPVREEENPEIAEVITVIFEALVNGELGEKESKLLTAVQRAIKTYQK